MPKLKKFTTKKWSYKNVCYILSVIVILITIISFYKSYAIYKLQQDYDVIKNKIGTYSMGDVRVAVLVDGKQTDTFPTYETNYKVEGVECTNGVTATFDVENWQIDIADMSATSTKCTISFNSKEINEITPINMSKSELLSLNEEIKNLKLDEVKTEVINSIYPIGSIYITTTESNVDAVKGKFGGTWVKYSTGTTLIGDDGTNYITNDTTKGSGGSSEVKLTKNNLPSHTHSISHTHTTPATSVSNWSALKDGEHNHNIQTKFVGYSGWPQQSVTGYVLNWNTTVLANSDTGTSTQNLALTANTVSYSVANGAHTHTVSGTIPKMTTASQSTTISGTAGQEDANIEKVNVQNPYTVVYMYKRTA